MENEIRPKEAEPIGIAKVSAGGRIVIPKNVIASFDIKDGSHIGFYDLNGMIVLRKMELRPID